MKLSRLIDPKFSVALDKLSKEPLPLRTAFKLKGMMKSIREAHLKYEEVRTEALRKYGLKNKDGSVKTDDKGTVQFDKDGLDAFSKDLNDLLSTDIVLESIKLVDLGEQMKLTLDDVYMLEDLIEE